MKTHTHTHTRTRTHTYIYKHTHTNQHSHTHTYKHIHTHPHFQIYTHLQPHPGFTHVYIGIYVCTFDQHQWRLVCVVLADVEPLGFASVSNKDDTA